MAKDPSKRGKGRKGSDEKAYIGNRAELRRELVGMYNLVKYGAPAGASKALVRLAKDEARVQLCVLVLRLANDLVKSGEGLSLKAGEKQLEEKVMQLAEELAELRRLAVQNGFVPPSGAAGKQ